MNSKSELERQVTRLKAELDEQKQENVKLKKALFVKGLEATTSESNSDPVPGENEIIRSKLWSSISHEILTPMDAILGMTDLVLETELSSDQRNYLEMINASADRLFSVVSDIIDFSVLMEGKLRRDLVNFDLFKELEYDLYIANLTCKHKDIGFSATFSKDIPTYLNSDPGRLRQVLTNLMSNAIKFTDDGEIAVHVDTSGRDQQGRLLLKFVVKDTGKGVLPEVQESIFHSPMGSRTGGDDDKYSEGGLGLVVSAKLVEIFGGEIGLLSSKGKGSTFWFTWPVVNPAEMYMGEIPEDIQSDNQDRSIVLQGADVLLAEDEHINASITKAVLEQAGLNVTVVNDGAEAVETMKKRNFHAVLMDVQMPRMDGIEATGKIRKIERERGTSCPIIALTAHGMHGDREKCLQAGMDDYLTKPLDKDQLKEMLARYMTKKALVVGSDPVNQHEIIQPLVERGWAVTIAETGRLAMYEASLAHFDMVVVDSSLPLEDGVDMVNTIRKLEQFSGFRSSIFGVGFIKEDAVFGDGIVDEYFSRSQVSEDFVQRVESIT